MKKHKRDLITLVKEVGNMCPHCLLMIALGTIGSGTLACLSFFRLKLQKIKQKYNDWKGRKWL